MYPVALIIIAINLHQIFGLRGQRGVAKTLWGSPAEQTREEMFVVKVK